MKFTKMSLVAALLIGSSAFAIDNIKMSGNAQLNYSTTDAKAGYAAVSNSDSLFSKDNSAADAALHLNVTADLAKNDLVTVSTGAGYSVLSTLGLENNFVSNVWGTSHGATAATGASYGHADVTGDGKDDIKGAKVENANWMDEAWVAVSLNKMSKTTLKLGRMELDTPLAFTEKWSVEKNTFEAAVVINQDIPDTTLVGAYVGNGNGNFGAGTVGKLGLAVGGVVNENGKFTTYGGNGAYAIGAINNSFKPVTVQAWYYSLTQLATAYWLQADLDMNGILAGAQYSSASLNNGNTDASSTFAGMVGYSLKDVATVKLAYSTVDKKGVVGAANTATSSGASKLYTEAWWAYGQVTQLDTDAITLTAEGSVADVDLLAAYTTVDHKAAGAKDLSEITLTASKSFGPLDATLAYIYTDDKSQADTSNMVQAYLTLNF